MQQLPNSAKGAKLGATKVFLVMMCARCVSQGSTTSSRAKHSAFLVSQCLVPLNFAHQLLKSVPLATTSLATLLERMTSQAARQQMLAR
eukprot:760714-Hanusia_phi.AAC.11